MVLTGVIVRWVDDRGFGFIQRGDGRGEVFVHKSALLWRDGVTPGMAVEFDVVEADGKTKASNVRREGQKASAPSGGGGSGLVFECAGRVSGVALFLVRRAPAQGDGDAVGALEVLLWHVPAKSMWESSGYFTEPSEKCIVDTNTSAPPVGADRFACFRRDKDAGGRPGSDERRTDLRSNNPTSRAVASIAEVLNIPPLVDVPHISVFQHAHGGQAFQSVFALVPPTHVRQLPDTREDRFDALRWFSVADVIDKTTGEKILQHTEQRVHLLASNHKVKRTLGID